MKFLNIIKSANMIEDVTIVLQTSSYTLALTDRCTVQKCLSASAIGVTINTNANVAFPVNTEIVILQYGAGVVTITPATNVTLNGGTAGIPLTGQYKAATLKQIATNEWLIIGSI